MITEIDGGIASGALSIHKYLDKHRHRARYTAVCSRIRYSKVHINEIKMKLYSVDLREKVDVCQFLVLNKIQLYFNYKLLIAN
jgi:hypothetical protein